MNMERLQLGRDAQRINRFHIMPTSSVQNVGAHSFGVCMLLLELTDGNASAALLKAGLYHDVPEAIVSDISSTTLRRFPALREAYKDAEHEVVKEFGLDVQLTDEEARLLKLADHMELAYFTFEEWRRGSLIAGEIMSRVMNVLKSEVMIDKVSSPTWKLYQDLSDKFSGVSEEW